MIREEKPIWIVVDGVDESTESCQSLAERLTGLLNRKPNYRVVVLGRSYVLTRTIETTKFSIDMSGNLNKEDIDAYINASLQKDIILSNTEITTRVSDALQAKAGGMFLWAKLMIDHLSRAANKEEALKRLEDLPRGLERAYVVILSRLANSLDTRDLLFARGILEITAIARRSLTIEETRIALALISGTGATYTHRLDVRLEQKISDLCGSLIVVTDGHLNLVHFSLKELLTRPMNEPQDTNGPGLSQFHINTDAAHRALGVACLEYMATLDYGSPLSDLDSFSELPRKHKFLNYASKHLPSHLVCVKVPDFLPNLTEFILSTSLFPWVEFLFMVVFDLRAEGVQLQEWCNLEDHLDTGLDGDWLDPIGPWVVHSAAWLKALREVQPDGPKYKFFEAVDGLKERSQHWIEAMGEESASAKLLLRVKVNTTYEGKNSGNHVEEISDSDSECEWSSSESSVDDVYLQLSPTPKLNQKKNLALNVPADKFHELLSSYPAFSSLQRSEVLSFEEEISTFIHLGNFLEVLAKEKALTSMSISLRDFVRKSSTIPVGHAIQIARFLEEWDDLNGALDVCLTIYPRIEQSNASDQNTVAFDIEDILCKQRRFEESETWCRRFVSQNSQEHGKEHELTLRWLESLSLSLWKQSENEESRAIDREVWEIRKRMLGESHVDTLSSARECSISMDDKVQAEELCRQTLKLREAHLGRDHADTLESYQDLLEHTLRKNADTETETLYWEILHLQRLQLGDEHEDTRDTAWNLIFHLQFMKKYCIAEAVCLRLLKIARKILGDTHFDTLLTVDALAECFERQRKYRALERLHRSLFRAFRKAYSIGHHKTLRVASKFVDTLFVNGNDEEAETTIRKILGTDHNILAAECRWRKRFAFELGILLYRQEKWFEAECTFREMLPIPFSGLKGENEWGKPTQLDEGHYFHLCSPACADSDDSSEDEDHDNMSNSADSDNSNEDKIEVGDSVWIVISDILQELKYVLTQQGKLEEADNIEFELGLEEQMKQAPQPRIWDDID
jgi:hypothetical protein